MTKRTPIAYAIIIEIPPLDALKLMRKYLKKIEVAL